MQQPQVVSTKLPASDVVIASVIVDAPRDGTADASKAVQAAINEAADAGGGVVFLPDGRYRLDQPLILREGVTLRGDWAPPSQGGAGVGTILMPMSGKGNADGEPAITLERGSGLREVTIWYPDQNQTAIVPYPWTLRGSTKVNGDNYTVLNVTLVNPYQGIKIGPEGNELHTIRNVYGAPLKTGIQLDTTSDIGRLINVRFAARYWENFPPAGSQFDPAARRALATYLARNATGIDMGRSDWEYVYQVSVDGYATGMVIRQGAYGTANAVMFGSEFRNCAVGLRLEKLNGIGLSVTGCSFTATDCDLLAPPSFDAVAQFNACTFEGTPRNGVRLEGNGTMTFQNCLFGSSTGSVVKADAGVLSLLGCNFQKASPDILLGAAVRRVRILGNRFSGKPVIEQHAQNTDVMVSNQPMSFDRPDVSPSVPPPARRPATNKLFVVTDFGAKVKAEDNTAAFDKALAAAKAAGGGTVYVPAGDYRFAGTLTVPTGVELRGIFDVPHHTISGGSVLMPVAGRGEENGTPFLQLEPKSGLRGLTVWYPEQNLMQPVAYPWTVRSLGPGCWVVDTTLGNAYQGVDFWTHPSDGHVISYLAGGVLRRGLFVSKCATDGWVEDVQFNPHYTLRLNPSLPHPAYKGDVGGAVIDYQRHYLEGIVFGRCANEHVRGTFLYASHDGIAFRDDGGGAHARVIEHGTDASSRAAVIEATAPKGVEFIDAQLVPLGKYEVGGIIVPDTFTGNVRFFNSQIWAGTTSGIIGGAGKVLIQQMNSLSGGFTLQGGDCALENIHFGRDLDPAVHITEKCQRATLVANLSSAGILRVTNEAGNRCRALADSLSNPPAAAGTFSLHTGWEPGQPLGNASRIATHGGGLHEVSKASCAPVKGDAHSGAYALRIAGNSDDPSYSYAYFDVFDEHIGVAPDSVLSYWLRPANEYGQSVGVDLLFTDGSVLRDSGAQSTDHQGVHPSIRKGTVGKWTRITIPIGKYESGKVIASIMFAFDSRHGGPFEAYVDDLSIDSEMGTLPWRVTASPAGGTCPVGTAVKLASPDGAAIRYTLDGMNPTPQSPVYEKPIVLTHPGNAEIRYAVVASDGQLSPWVFGQLYAVGGY